MTTIRNFEQAREYLHSFVDFERRGFRRHFADLVNLDTIRALLEGLGNPQERLAVLHLAGTKGKGSTAALAEAALREAGYRTGLYTSPHLLSMRERIRLEGKPISERRVVQLVRAVQPVVEAVGSREDLNPPTFFELYTAMGFLACAEGGVEVAVVETGLGGRLDATNVASPRVTAITTIGRDHTDILGDTLEQIAREKAGIIKPGVPLVLGAQAPEAREVILARARKLKAPVREAPRARVTGRPDVSPRSRQPVVTQPVVLSTGQGEVPIALPLLGEHQTGNLALAWGAIEELNRQGFTITREQFVRGVERVRWPGRFEVLERRPWLVVDCAHNAPSLRALAGTLRESLPFERLVLVLGMSADKEIAEAAEEIAPLADRVILTQAMVHRAKWASELARATWPLWRTTPYVCWTVAEALTRAREIAAPEDCICVTGSIFVVGEALRALGVGVR